MKRVLVIVLLAAPAAASPQLPNGSDSVDALPMAGPFPTIDEACTSAGVDCAPAPACGAPAVKLGAGFTEARVLAGCTLALHAAKGWYLLSTDGLPAWAGFLNNGDRYRSELASIAPSADGKTLLVRGTFVHDTNAQKMLWLAKPPADGWFECEDRLFVCKAGDGPSCAGPFPVTFTAYCRDGDHPEKALKRPEPHDFKFDADVAGTTLTMKGGKLREAPLPGWAVVAIDAPRMKDVKRPLSPERVELHFP
jgi:hypothetical protein